MTIYLLCYDLQQPPEDQLQQISYWLKYLNALLPGKSTLQQSPSFRIFIVGLRADMCSDLQLSKDIIHVATWRTTFPSLSIHDKSFFCSYKERSSLELLANELDEQLKILFKTHAQQVPRLYKDLENFRFYFSDNWANYLQSIGRAVFIANQRYKPSDIASIFSKFVSPEAVRARLLLLDPATKVSVLAEDNIGMILAIESSHRT